MKLRIIPMFAGVCLALASSAHAASILRITEVMSQGDTADWFEITNYGDTAATITGFAMDDDSFSFANSVPLVGISQILPGQSVVFVEGTADEPLLSVEQFRTNWGLPADMAIGGYGGSKVSFGGGGDGATVFNAAGSELPGPFAGLIRVSFGAATSGTSFEWLYDGNGDSVSPAAGQLTTGGWTYTDGTSVLRASPGMVIPEPGSLVLGGLGLLGLLRRRRA